MGDITSYEKTIQELEKKVGILKGQIDGLTKKKDGLVMEINQVIYKAKADAEKIVANAKEEAEKIIAAANELKEKNEAEARHLAKEGKDLKDKQNEYEKAQNNLVKGVERLEKDKADFAKDKKDKLAEINSAIKKAGELQTYIQSISQEISVKIAEITKA